MSRWLCTCMQIGPEAKYFISVTWELTPPPFCWLYTMPHRDIIVVLISGPKTSGPEPMEIWEKRLVNNVPTICYWTTVREYLLINCRFIRGQRVGHWPRTHWPMIFRLWTHKLCPLVTRFLERHGKVTRCFHGGNVCCTTG